MVFRVKRLFCIFLYHIKVDYLRVIKVKCIIIILANLAITKLTCVGIRPTDGGYNTMNR